MTLGTILSACSAVRCRKSDDDYGVADVYQHPDTNGRHGIGWESCPARHRPGQAADRCQSHHAIVLTPFHTLTIDTQMIEDTSSPHRVRMQQHADEDPIFDCRL